MNVKWVIAVVLLAAAPAGAQDRPALPGLAWASAEPDAYDAEGEEVEDPAAEAYEQGTEALDEERWDEAIRQFEAVVAKGTRKGDAARYWKAYAQHRAGRSADALGTIGELRRTAPQSRWLDDARVLELEIRQKSGQRVAPESQPDEELKLMALNGLAHQDPARAVPMLEGILGGSSSVKMKRQALFVLAQSNSAEARATLSRVARGEKHPQLQMEAIKYLGIFGGSESRQALSDIYAATNDTEVKKAVLHGFMTSGAKDQVLPLARAEKDPELREAAIHQLGIMGAQDELWQLYQGETSKQAKKAILHALFIGGGVERLQEALRTEQDPELRRTAIHSLGLVGGRASALLASLYQSEKDVETRRQVLNALFLQNNAAALVQIARTEKDPELRKSAVHWLSLMHNKEATDYLLEILNK
jgi:hypothetical protein